ncbi:hypothetical protein LEP1GSC115_3406 [Leptospira interrogans serovar Australis str. 200703203]|nr:hypothetical protein LEP1GSC115_3406 [Leptospira interrogans serovar Australis str. 200703203]
MAGINFEKLFEDKEFQYFGKKNGIVLFPYLNGVFSKFKKKF